MSTAEMARSANPRRPTRRRLLEQVGPRPARRPGRERDQPRGDDVVDVGGHRPGGVHARIRVADAGVLARLDEDEDELAGGDRACRPADLGVEGHRHRDGADAPDGDVGGQAGTAAQALGSLHSGRSRTGATTACSADRTAAGRSWAVMPPSTMRHWPVMYEAARRQEDHRRGDLFGLPDPAERYRRASPAHGFGVGACAAGGDGAGRHGVDPDAIGREVERGRAGEGLDATLRRSRRRPSRGARDGRRTS